ncbi:MAG: thermonuclease family protein [Candidatus Omnitrophica bacterium]|nr:thermonuclease family protein [Candidatus Omnitrophota bacterium]MDD5690248.1 thermonuclease family protein [Candidatus Omnitrophota bacterium]
MSRKKTRNKKFVFLLVSGVLVLAGYFFANFLNPCMDSKKESNRFSLIGSNYDYSNILVKRVVDGDTLKLENGEYVRLLGIDTPEMHESAKLHRDARRSGQGIDIIKQLGRQSYGFTRQMAEGKRVRLEFDKERYDRYNRILAYVYLPDGRFLNAMIVEEGYASLMTYPPNVKYADLFSRLYREARENKRGLWRQ